MPGGYTGFLKDGSQQVHFESFNAAYIDFKDEQGNNLMINNGKGVSFRIPVSSKNKEDYDHDTYFWEYRDGRWEQEQYINSEDIDENFTYSTNISRSGWKNVDKVMPVRYATGTAYNGNDVVRNGYVMINGSNYNCYSYARTDSNGRYTIPLKEDDQSKVTFSILSDSKIISDNLPLSSRELDNSKI